MNSLRLDWCKYPAAKYAVESWHYSRSMPASKLVRIGVWEDDKFKGVVIFGVGANNHLVMRYGLGKFQGCELVRIALNDHVAPVSRIVAIALKMLKKRCPGLRLVVSFADPRFGHAGKIYQAGNWSYDGTSDPAPYPVIDGRIRHPRTLSERIRNGQAGSRKDYQFVKLPGKYRYLMPLDEDMKKRIEPLRQIPPKFAAEVKPFDTPGDQPGKGGSTPTRPLQFLYQVSAHA